MKKRIGVSCLTSLLLFSLFGCDGGTKDLVHFTVGNYEATVPVEIDRAKFLQLVETDLETIALYIYTSGCVTCEDFSDVLDQYIVETHLTIYKINIEEMKKINSKYYEALQLEKYKAPNFSIWENGELVKSYNSIHSPKFFAQLATFKAEMAKIITLPRQLFISIDTLDQKIAANEKFIIYYTRNDCSDCSFVDSAFFADFLPKTSDVFYALEINTPGIRYNENWEFDAAIYKTFTDNYGLSNVNNPLGYRTGHVPTFQYYENGEIVAMDVYLNDQYTKTDNGDGTFTYEIVESYFGDELVGHTFIGDGTSLAYKEEVKDFHNDKLQTFFDTYLPKCD